MADIKENKDGTTTVTLTIRDGIPTALRDDLIRNLEGAPPHVVGNLADLQRLGAQQVAKSGGDDTYRVHPDVEDPKDGAKRTIDEEAAAKEQMVALDGSVHTPEGPEETGAKSNDPTSTSPEPVSAKASAKSSGNK